MLLEMGQRSLSLYEDFVDKDIKKRNYQYKKVHVQIERVQITEKIYDSHVLYKPAR